MSEFNLDNLLDGTLDDLADAPEFKPFPPGTHRVTLSLNDKTKKDDWVGGHPAVEARMKFIEMLETSDPEAIAPAPGSEDSCLFMLDNEYGQGDLKKVLAIAAEQFGAKPNRVLIEEFKNVECLVVTKARQNKDKTKTYTGIVEVQIV